MFDTQLVQERMIAIRDVEAIPEPEDLPDELKPWFGNGLTMWAKPEMYRKEKGEEEDEHESKLAKKYKREFLKPLRYYIGVDTSEGNTKDADFSVIEVIDEDGFQCAELRTKTKPFILAEVANALGHYYNDAMLIIEKANSGIAVLAKLNDDYGYYNLFKSVNFDGKKHQKEYGFSTNSKTKPKIINDMVEWFEKGWLTINSKQLLNEMLAFSFKGGRMEAQSGHDDTVLGMALALAGLRGGKYYR